MRIIYSLTKKEFLQILRERSSFTIAFILPLLLLLIYMFGLNMDSTTIILGIKDEDKTHLSQEFISAFMTSPYIEVHYYSDNASMFHDIGVTKINGALTIPMDFAKNIQLGGAVNVHLIIDGTEFSTANFVNKYVQSITQEWALGENSSASQLINLQSRFWFNQNIESQNFILPGSLAITMTLIGILLTALVIAREWEKGTMEALLALKVSPFDFLVSKYVAYYILGMASMLFSVFLCIFVFNIPFRGTYWVLFVFCSMFLLCSLGIGFLISTILRNQFLASQAAVAAGFLPALLLSGLMFSIQSMPLFFQYATLILPPRHFVTLIQNEFMSGTNMEIFIKHTLYLFVLALFFFLLVYKLTPKKLD